ncbi:MAG: SGNH/GDSL hydrolase family protein [Clostridiales bacterium]
MKTYFKNNQNNWIGTWVCALQKVEKDNLIEVPDLNNKLLRQIIHTSIMGKKLRLKISNEYGQTKLCINSISIALSNGKDSIRQETSQLLSFNGNYSVEILSGEEVISDSIEYELPATSNLAITINLKEVPINITGHPGSRTTSYIKTGNDTSTLEMTSSKKVIQWFFLKGLYVLSNESNNAIAVIGDSITDGRGSTTDKNNRWPDNLSTRLQKNITTSDISVLNLGIGGNSILHGGLGPTLLERLERDILNENKVKWLIILAGVNDIGESISKHIVNDLIEAYMNIIDMAHRKNIFVFGIPVLPFGGSQYDNDIHQYVREKVNTWIRTSEKFDFVIDLETCICDPENKKNLSKNYDCGDHLHLNERGYKKMADEIDLNIFKN